MAKYRSASLHVLGCEKASPADIAELPGLSDIAMTVAGETPASPPAEVEEELPGPARHALARPRPRKAVAPAWVAGCAAALALLGLVAWGSHDALGPRKSQGYPCPPGTTSAVQAATGCAVPAQPGLDGEDEE